jgi:hypothetical protein
MIGVKEATEAAAKFAREVYGPELDGVSLEEIELSPAEDQWLVTLGLRRRDKVLGVVIRPDYKVFRVDRETGTVRSMTIRAA